jgi:predicted nucleic acid-binding protein
MSWLLDTNVLLRLADEQSPDHAVAAAAIERLLAGKESVDGFQVAGKHTHDARLAALLLVHGVRRLLTFNTTDFPPAWGVDAMHPSGPHPIESK